MLALTLIQPMGWAIIHGHKPYENRSRDMRPLAIRGVRTRIAIHNGAKWDDSYGQMVHHYTGSVPRSVPMAVIGVATLTGRVFTLADPPPAGARRVWFFGPFAFEIDLAESRALPSPVPCKGALGFWRLSDDVERDVVRQLRCDEGGPHKVVGHGTQCFECLQGIR